MDELKIDFKFKVGQEVRVYEDESCTISRVLRRWSRVNKVGEDRILVEKSYTIQPPVGQRFKISEERLVEIRITSEGIAF